MKALVGVVLALAACGENLPQTQVRLVVETDLGVPDPITLLNVNTKGQSPDTLTVSSPRFPFLVAVRPDARARRFSLSVILSSHPSNDVLVVRDLGDVAFVQDAARMLKVPVLAKCACHGTSCPPPGDPDCDPIVAPQLMPLDETTAGLIDGLLFASD